MALDRLRQPPDNRDPYYQEEPDWMEYLERTGKRVFLMKRMRLRSIRRPPFLKRE